MSRPVELKYTPTHEWVRVEGDVATVGITDHAVESLGDITYLILPEAKTKVTKGKPFGEIESSKAAEQLYAPVTGEVIEVNTQVAEHTQALGESPFGDGWMIRIRMADPGEVASLLSADAYAERILAEEH